MKLFTNLSGIAAAMLLATGIAAQAQDFPNKPVTMIVPYAAGGIADSTARAVATGLSKTLGQQVVVDNRAGGGGKLGASQMMESAPDGYTIALFNHAIATFRPVLDESFDIAPGRDYAPIGLFSETLFILAASPSAPFKTVEEMIAYGKANPNKINYASSGIGTNSHLGFEFIKQLTGMEANHVPYTGEAQATSALIGGESHVMLLTGSAKQNIDAGQLVGMATTGTERWSIFPDVPTAEEAGLAGFQTKGWFGLSAPKDTPAEVVEKLGTALAAAMADPEVAERVETLGNVIKVTDSDGFRVYVEEDLARWGPVAEKAGIRLD